MGLAESCARSAGGDLVTPLDDFGRIGLGIFACIMTSPSWKWLPSCRLVATCSFYVLGRVETDVTKQRM